MSASKLFQPLKLGNGNITLNHRVVMAPLTRYRSSAEHVHGDLPVEYYRQRSKVPGTLLITEATFIAEEAGGFPNVPGIWSEEQVKGWSKVTEAVHENKSFIFLQLWALGRAAQSEILKLEGHPFVSASDIPLKAKAAEGAPTPLSEEDIKRYHGLYETAAKNAIRAGFDGVEIHGANGYLIDQFLQDVSNKRTDAYGGSPENQTRFALEVVKVVTDAVGVSRTGIRISPFGTFQDMHMDDPVPTYTHLVKKLAADYSDFAYLHVVEPDEHTEREGFKNDSSEFIRKIWSPRPYLSANGYNPEKAIKVADANENTAIVFGKWFISNPDLPDRIKTGKTLTPFNPKTFYLFGPDKSEGYTDYPLTLDEAYPSKPAAEVEVKA